MGINSAFKGLKKIWNSMCILCRSASLPGVQRNVKNKYEFLKIWGTQRMCLPSDRTCRNWPKKILMNSNVRTGVTVPAYERQYTPECCQLLVLWIWLEHKTGGWKRVQVLETPSKKKWGTAVRNRGDTVASVFGTSAALWLPSNSKPERKKIVSVQR
jgi:hypothetical protein